MDDETTIDHGREEFRPAPGERRSGQCGSIRERESSGATRNTGPLDNRPSERYVPSAVACERCDCSGESFTWLQSVPVGDVDGERPIRELYFCDIVCLGLYCGEYFDDYDPTLRPVSHQYEGRRAAGEGRSKR